MEKKITLSNNAIIVIDTDPLASGGEGDIHEIVSPSEYSQQVLKIYKKEKITKSKEAKLKFLIENKPNFTITTEHHSVIWPIHIAYDGNSFVGYTMPKASGVKLELLCHQKLPKHLPKEWQKFSFDSPGAIESRLKLCFNICAAVSQIHSFGSYVLVDMKPDNIMVKPNGLISIIDIDSIEVIKSHKVLFSAHVATPEYTPPEYYAKIKNIELNLIEESWDRFSVAVIIYRILFGIHPFTASLNPPFDNISSINEIIEKGFFPHGKNKEKFRIIPPPHKNFYRIERQIQHLFLKAFDDGHENSYLRPSVDDWCRLLSPEPVIIINRQPPSKLNSYFLPSYSQDISFKAIPDISVKMPVFLKEPKEGVLEKLFKAFKSNEKQKFFKEILQAQYKVDSGLAEIKSIKSKLISEREKVISNKKEILEDEKLNIDTLLSKYRANSNSIDRKANEFFEMERRRRIDFQKTYLREFNEIESKIKEEYERNVVSFEVVQLKIIENLKFDLAQCIKQESEEIKLLDIQLKNKLDIIKADIRKFENDFYNKAEQSAKTKLKAIEKKRHQLILKEKILLSDALEKYQSLFTEKNLNQFKIYDDRYIIFTDSYADPDKICKNLANSGVFTAADIKGVDELGKILKADGSWIKVPEVAKSRAKNLNEWRKKKERMSPISSPPQSLPYTEELAVKQTLASELQSIEDEEKKIHQEILNAKSKISTTLSVKLEDAKKREQQETVIIQLSKAGVAVKYDTKKKEINLEINKESQSLNRSKQSRINQFQNAIIPLEEKKEKLLKLKDSFELMINQEFDQLHFKLADELRNLDSEFMIELHLVNSSTEAKIRNENSQYETIHKLIVTDLQHSLQKYNDSAVFLVKLQQQYEAMN